MANFLNSVNPSNFGLNVTGNFNNIASSGNFPLPNTDIVRKLNSKGGPSKDPIGTIQISAGSGNFDSNPNIYIRDEELGEADNISVSSAGTGYTVANSVITTPITGAGNGLVINIVTVSGIGGISTVLIVNGGLGYVQGDTVRVNGGNGDAFLTIGVIDLPKNRLVLDSRSNIPNLQGAPISGIVLIPPTENPNASFIATDGTVAYFSRFATNYGYSLNDTITLNNPQGGTAAVITVTGTPGINGQVGTANTSINLGGTDYQQNDVLTQVSTSGVGRLFTCTVNSVDGAGGILIYSVGLQFVKDFQGYTKGTGWQSFTSQGGVATAAGANTQIQFNNNGNLGANPGLTLDTSASPITLTSGISGGALSKNIFNSQEFTIEDTLSGTARLHIESNQFSTNPAIELSFSPVGNQNVEAIKLSTTNFAGILLETVGGQITQKTTSGGIQLSTETGPLTIERSVGAVTSALNIGSTGDVTLSTNGTFNEIRLQTSAVSSEIILQTTAAGCDIQLNASGLTSGIDLTAMLNINATSESLEVSNNASTGSKIQMQGGIVGSVLNLEDTVGGDNIILTGTNGTLQLGAAGSTGDLQVKNTLNAVVAQLDIDGTNAGQLKLFDDDAGTATQSIFLSGNTGLGEFGGANTSGELTLIENGVTNVSVDATNSTVRLTGKTGLSAPLDRVVLMGEPTVTAGGFAAASTVNGGIAATIYGGLTILPNLNYNGSANTPMPDSNIIMGQYGWNNTNGPTVTNIAVSVKNSLAPILYGGSGNIYCNQIRQNIYSFGGSTPVNIGFLTAGFTGNGGASFRRQYYNGGNARYITIAVNQEPNNAKEVTLPRINMAMLGMVITVVRLRQNPSWYPGNNSQGIPRSEVAVYIYPDTAGTDLMSAPDSVWVRSGSVASGGGVALDPYQNLVGVAGYTTPLDLTPPQPYSEIGSATFVASAYGDGQVIQGTPSRFFWHYIDAFPGK
jgi:hypothetical protein